MNAAGSPGAGATAQRLGRRQARAVVERVERGNGRTWAAVAAVGVISGVLAISAESQHAVQASGFFVHQGDPAMKIQMDAAKAVAVVGAMAVAGVAQAQQQAVQWRVEDGGNGHWYQLLRNPAGLQHWSWADAAMASTFIGGHLVTFHSQAECAAAYAQLGLAEASATVAWIGFLQQPGSTEPDGGWHWCTDEAVTFINWKPGNPDDSGCSQFGNHQNFAIVGSGGDTRWDDQGDPTPACPYGVAYAIVEFDADCNNDGIVDYGQIRAGQIADENGNDISDICECAVHPELGACCPGDLYVDGRIDGADLAAILSHWGPAAAGTREDLNHDGVVDGADLGLLLSNWGPCHP